MENIFFDERYMMAVKRIADMKNEYPESRFNDYFNVVSDLIVRLDGVMPAVKNGDYRLLDEALKKQLIDGLYSDILPENYDASYANPDVAVEKFGKCGKLLSALYYMLIVEIPKVFIASKWEMTVLYLRMTG